MALDPVSQAIGTMAAGIAGTLGYIKLQRFITSRRAGPDDGEAQDEVFREHHERLFPNGEKDQIIQRLDELGQQNRERRKEYLELKSDIRDISARLEKRGI